MPTTDVFISHSSADSAAARRVCAALEIAGLKCWTAQRDIPTGANYANAIMAAIRSSRVMVVLVSPESIASPHVYHEIERAFHYQLELVPVRLTASGGISKEFEYFLAAVQWFDLGAENTDALLTSLVNGVCGIAQQPRRAPASDSNSAQVQLTADLATRVNLALQQNHVPFFRRLELLNITEKLLADIQIRVTATPAFFAPWQSRIDLIAPDATYLVAPVPLMLAPDFLAAQAEREAGFVEIVVESAGEVLYTERKPVDVLSPHEWGGFAMLPELLAAFVRPNAEVLSSLLRQAAVILQTTTGDSSISGYQRHDPKRVFHIAQSIYEAVQTQGVTYINPPASFEKSGQKIRTHEQVLEHKLGTCLDLTVLLAALLEQAGLNPLLILAESHAYPGVWLTDFSLQEPTLDDPRPIRKRVELGEALVFDSSAVAQGGTFEQARKTAEARLRKDEEFSAAIDVRCARAHAIRPLPFDRDGVRTLPVEAQRTTGPIPHSATPEDRFRFVTDAPELTAAAASRVDRWKAKLLDLSLRNRLLNYRATKSTCGLQLVDCAALEDALAGDGVFSVESKLAIRSLEARLVSGGGELDDDALTTIVREHQSKSLLHTDLAPAEHDKVMTELFRQSRTAFDESGAILLYVTIGMLEWFETPSSTQPRFAPLVLVPVLLSRGKVVGGWSLRRADDETRVNVTLLKKLESDFGMNVAGMDVLPEDASGVDIPRILHSFRQLVRNQGRWLIHDNAHLGLFSFQKFLMWLDLEAKQAALMHNPVVAHLFSGSGEPFPLAAELVLDVDLDHALLPDKTLHVVDADPSQMTAILAAEAGSSFVLQGPPGTGKSQTITNLIAQLLARGKTVLFVSEKLAALEVVHTRLAKVGLAPFCLELHSNQASKAAVMGQLRAALDVSRQHNSAGWEQHAAEVHKTREELNAYAKTLDQPSPFGTSTRGVLAWLFGAEKVPRENLPAIDLRALNSMQVAQLQQSTRNLVSAVQEAGGLAQHPWSSVHADDWDPAWQRQVGTVLGVLDERALALEALRADVATLLELAADMPVPVLVAAARVALDSPAPPRALLDPGGFVDRMAKLDALLQRGRTFATRRATLLETWQEGLLALEVTPLRQKVEQWAPSFFLLAWLMLCGTRKQLKMLVRTALPALAQLGGQLRDAEWLRSEAQALLSSDAAMLLGRFWQGPESDWTETERVLNWARQFRNARAALDDRSGSKDAGRKLLALCTGDAAQVEQGTRANAKLRDFLDANGPLDDALAEVKKLLKLDGAKAFGPDCLPARMSEVCRNWLQNLPRLRNWCALVTAMDAADGLGLAPLMQAVEAGRIDAAQLPAVLDRSLREAWWEDRLAAEPLLRQFRGASHAELIARFRKLDKQSLVLAQKEVVARVAKRSPDANAPGDEMGLITRQLKLKRGHMAIRQLFAKIPTTLKRLKPCVLMSPLSVAQYLDPSIEGFDVVVFDEASQIPPWDAVGAIARGKQVIVVGDSKQLPPTSFFDRGDNDDDETALDDEAVHDTESILDEMIAARLRELQLKWHYRSKHESLIAFSNWHYYDNRLHTFPSAAEDVPELGVKLVKVAGFYDRGGSRTNRAEAEAVVNEMFRLLALPESERPSIGVVTFSQVQQRLVEDLVDKRLQQQPEFQNHFSDDDNEPVFIKNLENVQGDERDVMLFSICYGPDQAGKITMNFGPLNRKGGERRLNVAVTRARKRLSVFSTLDWGQIDENKSRATGVAHLKAFLRYAALGPQSLLSTTSAAEFDDFASPFEEEVHRVLSATGWQVKTQVGCSGYRIDLGVVDPERQGTYLLGIECDGHTYHGSRVARERDRLREEVLVSLGWQIHRIWATDWWYDRANATARLLAAVAEAQARARAGTPPMSADPLPIQPPPPPARPQPTAAPSIWPAGAARSSPVAFLGNAGLRDDFESPLSRPHLADSVQQMVAQFGPVHVDAVTRTIAAQWGFGRIGRGITEQIQRAVATLPTANRPHLENGYFWPEGVRPATWRAFRYVEDGEARKLDEVPPEEIANAAAWVLQRALSISQTELVRETAKTMGVKAVTAKTANLVENALPLLATSRRGVVDGAKWRVVETAEG